MAEEKQKPKPLDRDRVAAAIGKYLDRVRGGNEAFEREFREGRRRRRKKKGARRGARG